MLAYTRVRECSGARSAGTKFSGPGERVDGALFDEAELASARLDGARFHGMLLDGALWRTGAKSDSAR